MEILGLLHLAADHDLTAEPTPEHYRAVRADGSERSFAVPRFALPHPDLSDAATSDAAPSDPRFVRP